MKSIIEEINSYFNNTPQSIIDETWAKYEQFDQVGPKVSELLSHFETHFEYEEFQELEAEIQNSKIKTDSPKVSGFFFIN
jgi:uncharacterized FlgJ-related protein